MQPLPITNGMLPSTLDCADDDDGGGGGVEKYQREGGRRRTSSPSAAEGEEDVTTRRRRHSNGTTTTITNNINNNLRTMPDSPRSFDSNELFEDVLDETYEDSSISSVGINNYRITDDDLERLMGNDDNTNLDENEPFDYRRRQSQQQNITSTTRPSSCILQQYYRVRAWLCPCCCNHNHRRKQQQQQQQRHNNNNKIIGNMILLFPDYCVTKFNCGILGPHWFGPVACLILLSGATSRLVPRSYRTIGPITAQTCLVFYLVSVLLLLLVSCRDPGIVRSIITMGGEEEEEEEQMIVKEEGEERCANDNIVAAGYMLELSVGAGGRRGRGRGALSGRASDSSSRGLNTNGNQRRGGGGRDDGWRYCDLCR